MSGRSELKRLRKQVCTLFVCDLDGIYIYMAVVVVVVVVFF